MHDVMVRFNKISERDLSRSLITWAPQWIRVCYFDISSYFQIIGHLELTRHEEGTIRTPTFSRKYIYTELFHTNSMGPYTQQGAARTQWEEQQAKSPKNYLKKMTSATKNLMQISFIRDAGGQINWVGDLDAVFVCINRSINPLQSGKWDAERQISDALKIPTALIKARKHSSHRVGRVDSNIAFPERSKQGKPTLQLGDETPLWMQRLAKDDMAKYSRRSNQSALLNITSRIPYPY